MIFDLSYSWQLSIVEVGGDTLAHILQKWHFLILTIGRWLWRKHGAYALASEPLILGLSAFLLIVWQSHTGRS